MTKTELHYKAYLYGIKMTNAKPLQYISDSFVK